MDALLQFFKGIGNVITSVIDFVIGFFQDLVYLIQLTGRFLAQIPNYFSWLPSVVTTMLIVLFSIVVVYKILGREG